MSLDSGPPKFGLRESARFAGSRDAVFGSAQRGDEVSEAINWMIGWKGDDDELCPATAGTPIRLAKAVLPGGETSRTLRVFFTTQGDMAELIDLDVVDDDEEFSDES